MMYNIKEEKILGSQIIDAINNAIKYNSGDSATTEILINVGCEIFDISQDAIIEILDCVEETDYE